MAMATGASKEIIKIWPGHSNITPVKEYRQGRRFFVLCFINYKDAMMYNVVIQTFQLMRSAEDPMLYNYTIVMRAYNLRGIAEFQYDMAPSDSQIAAQLGIDGIKESSIFATIKDNVSGAKSVASAAAGSIKGF